MLFMGMLWVWFPCAPAWSKPLPLSPTGYNKKQIVVFMLLHLSSQEPRGGERPGRCLSGPTLWPLNCPRLWRSHVTSTFTVHQAQQSSSTRGWKSHDGMSVNRREQACTDWGFLICGLELLVKLLSSDARERVQKCSRNLVSCLFLIPATFILGKMTVFIQL